MTQKENLFNFSLQNCKVVESSKKTQLMDVNRAMGIYLPEEIIVEIISRLPLWSVVQFKCVSKFWKTLISDPCFKKMLLNRAKNDQNCQKFLVSHLYPNKGNAYSFSSSYLSEFHVQETRKLDCPSNCKPWDQKIYCYCDGLFLVGVRNGPDTHLIILLWNPTTRESMVLPQPELPPPEDLCTWGLGYDSTSDDYKILKIHHKVCSEILALKSGFWRKIDNHPTGIYPNLSGMDSLAFVHGAFHWIGSSQNYYYVVSFNISNEVYGEILLPEKLCLIANVEYVERGVSVLDGKLYYYRTSTYLRKGTFYLWVMQDYGVKESWNRCYFLNCPDLYSAIPKYRSPKRTLIICCKILNAVRPMFWTNHRPFLCSWPQGDIMQEGFTYTESLVFPKLIT